MAAAKQSIGWIGLGQMGHRMSRHLANAVHTGTFCSYTPERPAAWEL